MAFFINSIRTNAFYEKNNLQSRFGLTVPNFMEQAVNFFQNNNLPGPIFNDLGIGSYLEWKLYPTQKVFSDDRPEAYPENFWQDVYKMMQTDHKIWQDKSAEYGIRSIIFDYTVMDPAGQKFIFSMLTDPDWPLVFVNDRILIFVKKSKDTQKLISVQPDNYYGYERHALTLAAGINENGENNDLILTELQKAIALDSNDANDYFVIAFIFATKNDLVNAKIAIQKAYQLNPYDKQIKSLYLQLEK